MAVVKNFWTVALVLSPAIALAGDPGECFVSGFPMANVGGELKYKINAADGELFMGTDLAAEQAVVLGASVWNEQANSTYFTYTGNTTADDFSCTDDWSLVIFIDACNRADVNIAADTEKFCPDGAGNNTRFKIYVYRHVDDNNDNDCNDAGETRTFGNSTGVGDCGAADTNCDTRDLAGIIAHEFGHVAMHSHCNMNHDGTITHDEVWCTMRTGQRGNPSWRSLRKWDQKCSADHNERSLTGYSRQNTTTGTFGSAVAVSGAGAVTKIYGGVTYDGATSFQAVAGHRRTAVAWVEAPTSSTTWTNLTNPSSTNAVGFLPAHLHETTSTDRVWYSYWDDDPGGAFPVDTEHYARQIRSTDEFASDQDPGYLYECNAYHTGTFLDCSSWTAIRTAHPMAVAWEDTVNATVSAWVNQSIGADGFGDEAASNEIWISVGFDPTAPVADTDVLAKPHETGLRSAVGPGLACSPNYSGTYDCILAYVPISDTTNQVKVKRFSVAASTNDYAVTFESGEYSVATSARSANALTLWRNGSTDEFFLAARSSNADQKIFVYSSAAGATWSLETSNLDSTVTGPSAICAMEFNINFLHFAK